MYDGVAFGYSRKIESPDGMVLNRSAPRAIVVPILVYEDVTAAIEWLCSAFGFIERLRAGAPGGVVSHAQLTVGDGAIMLGRQGAEFRPPRAGEVNQYVTVHVDDVDRHYERSKAYGAIIVKAPMNMPFGERQYTAHDLGGHRWTFSQSIAASRWRTGAQRRRRQPNLSRRDLRNHDHLSDSCTQIAERPRIVM